jgi:hypothetical protein
VSYSEAERRLIRTRILDLVDEYYPGGLSARQAILGPRAPGHHVAMARPYVPAPIAFAVRSRVRAGTCHATEATWNGG